MAKIARKVLLQFLLLLPTCINKDIYHKIAFKFSFPLANLSGCNCKAESDQDSK